MRNWLRAWLLCPSPSAVEMAGLVLRLRDEITRTELLQQRLERNLHQLALSLNQVEVRGKLPLTPDAPR